MLQAPPAEPGMREDEIDTPALVIDLDAFEHNLDTMAALLAPTGAKLRAHAKTHKSAVIAKLQMARGAIGQCVQKVAEAEQLAWGGIPDVLVTNQVVSPRKLARLAADARRDAQSGVLQTQLGRVLDAVDSIEPARLAQELALLAVKTDVTEELDRLAAHVEAARALLAETGPVGRKFDFLMQEFMREANTLCSKSQDIQLTRIGLDLKTVIDQMREQVQNVE